MPQRRLPNAAMPTQKNGIEKTSTPMSLVGVGFTHH